VLSGLRPLHSSACVLIHQKSEVRPCRFVIECAVGAIVVTGLKAWDFYDRFCSHKIGQLKSDGKDIVAVTMALQIDGRAA
jgi:hypothetical protein